MEVPKDDGLSRILERATGVGTGDVSRSYNLDGVGGGGGLTFQLEVVSLIFFFSWVAT